MRGLSAILLVGLGAAACSGSSAQPEGPPPGPAVPEQAAPVTTAAETAAPAASPAPSVEVAAPPTATASAAPAEAPAPAASTAAAAAGPPGANLHVGSMTVDGLTFEDLSCRADGLGLLGSLVVVGGISKKKAALNACAPKGDRPRVEWSASKGAVGKVKVKAATPAIEACVTKALASTQAPFEGECAATLVLGK